MEPFPVQILAADHPFYEGPCLSLVLPTITGMYGIRTRHRTMITAVVPGVMRYLLPGEEEQVASVSSGMVKIENGEVMVLVDAAERPEEIDLNRARREADAAKEALLQKRSIREYRMAQISLARAVSRMRVKSRHGNQG